MRSAARLLASIAVLSAAFGVDNLVRLGVNFVWMGVECKSLAANFAKNQGADPRALVNTYPGQGFDHAGLQADPNLLIPLDRLREMIGTGELGGLGPRVVSLCGHLTKPKVLIDETAPEVARVFIEDGIDVALLVPA